MYYVFCAHTVQYALLTILLHKCAVAIHSIEFYIP